MCYRYVEPWGDEWERTAQLICSQVGGDVEKYMPYYEITKRAYWQYAREEIEKKVGHKI